MLKKIKEVFQHSYTDDTVRKQLMFSLLNAVLCIVAFVMTVVNIITGELVLMVVTLAYSLLCLFNLVMGYFRGAGNLIYITFTVETMIMIAFFIVSGIPNGFSVLWVLIIPSFVLAIFRSRVGSIFCILTLLMIIFFFWFPLGRSFLMYEYSETFMLRFPFVYIALFLIALYIETIRMGTWKKLRESEINYRRLYRHDALTGIYSRHAFYDELGQVLGENTNDHVSLVILDIDDFKRINDRYGHNAGDEVLRSVTRIILDNICQHCVACRWGGEEFLVLMQCGHDAYEMAERIRKTIEDTEIVYGEYRIKITVSVGVSTAKYVSEDQISDFINKADGAMYASKEKGKNLTTVNNF